MKQTITVITGKVDAVADRIGSIGDKVANLKKDLKRLQGT